MTKEQMMTAPKHTPGPWTYLPPDKEFENGHIFSEDNERGGFVCACVAGIENPADATLIAASPTLLQVLKEAVPHLEYMAGGMTHAPWKTKGAQECLERVLAAISMASGGQT